MPLSDHEQRLLEQMERALYQEDPKFATSLRHGRGAAIDRMRILVGASVVIGGLVAVVAGVALSFIPLGVLGFAAMIGGAVWAWSGTRSGAASDNDPTSESGSAPRKTSSKNVSDPSSFMNKMEDRWRKRREEGDGR